MIKEACQNSKIYGKWKIKYIFHVEFPAHRTYSHRFFGAHVSTLSQTMQLDPPIPVYIFAPGDLVRN